MEILSVDNQLIHVHIFEILDRNDKKWQYYNCKSERYQNENITTMQILIYCYLIFLPWKDQEIKCFMPGLPALSLYRTYNLQFNQTSSELCVQVFINTIFFKRGNKS